MTRAPSFWNGPLSDDTHVTMNKRSTASHGTKPKKNGKALRSATADRGIGVLEIPKPLPPSPFHPLHNNQDAAENFSPPDKAPHPRKTEKNGVSNMERY